MWVGSMTRLHRLALSVCCTVRHRLSGKPPMSSMFATCQLIGPFLESARLLGSMVDNHYTPAFQNFNLICYSDHMRMEVFGGNPHENSVSPKLCFPGERELGLNPDKPTLLVNETFAPSPRKPKSP